MRSLKLVLVALLLIIGALHNDSNASSVQQANECVTCHRAIERLYSTSVHHKFRSGCSFCHGGDQSQTDKVKAHSGIALKQGIWEKCGQCHEHQLALFKASRHNPATRNAPRVDCADCHGKHTIGTPPDDFAFSNVCAGCHGLEYLPALPAPFIALLNLSDDLRRRTKELEGMGVNIPLDIKSSRDGMRAGTGEIVHATDLTGGLARIPQLLNQGENVKRRMDALLKR